MPFARLTPDLVRSERKVWTVSRSYTEEDLQAAIDKAVRAEKEEMILWSYAPIESIYGAEAWPVVSAKIRQMDAETEAESLTSVSRRYTEQEAQAAIDEAVEAARKAVILYFYAAIKSIYGDSWEAVQAKIRQMVAEAEAEKAEKDDYDQYWG